MFDLARCPDCGAVRQRSDTKCFKCGRLFRQESSRQESSRQESSRQEGEALGAVMTAGDPQNRSMTPSAQCPACGQVAGTNLGCRTCSPLEPEPLRGIEAVTEIGIPPYLQDLSGDAIVPVAAPLVRPRSPAAIARRRVLIAGILAAVPALAGGYFWGRSDQRERDQRVIEAMPLVAAQVTTLADTRKDRSESKDNAPDELTGIAGTRWGQPLGEVNRLLAGQFRPVPISTIPGGGIATLHYDGSFAGFPASDIAAELCHDQLRTVRVRLGENQSRYGLWREIFNAMRSAYGAPTHVRRPTIAEQFEQSANASLGVSGPPGDLALPSNLRTAEFLAAVDKALLDPSQALQARWDLAQGTSILLAAEASPETGKSPAHSWLEWTFAGPDAEDACDAAPEIGRAVQKH